MVRDVTPWCHSVALFEKEVYLGVSGCMSCTGLKVESAWGWRQGVELCNFVVGCTVGPVVYGRIRQGSVVKADVSKVGRYLPVLLKGQNCVTCHVLE